LKLRHICPPSISSATIILARFFGFYTEGILSMGKWDWLLAASDAEWVARWINKLKDSTLIKCGT